jgi:hypothetical protein
MGVLARAAEKTKYVLPKLPRNLGNDLFSFNENIRIISFYLWYLGQDSLSSMPAPSRKVCWYLPTKAYESFG